MAPTRTLRVAAVQASSENGASERNLDNCAALVAEAAGRGAELLLCPELLATGYRYEESIWEQAEPRGGLTETWLHQQARAHHVTIGAGYLEADGEHFYNTFALFDEDGLVGRVRKRSLPFFEGWFFTPCEEAKILDTKLGRVAVGICNDTQTAGFMNDVIAHQPDLILMPHSAPTLHAPTPRVPPFATAFRRVYDSQLSRVAERYAKSFGVPVVMANKASDELVRSEIPHSPHMPYWPRFPLAWTFEGHSTIVDARGSRLAYQKGGEGVLVETVTLDPSAKRSGAKPRGYWSFAPRLFARAGGALFSKLEKLGMQAYRDNPRRRHAALQHRPPSP